MKDQILLLAIGVLLYAWLYVRARENWKKKRENKDIIQLRLKRYVG